MHDEVYEKLSKDGKVSWDGLDSVDLLLGHHIPVALAQKINHYFPIKKGLRAVDLGCGTGPAALYLAKLGFDVRGYDVSTKAIEMAIQNMHALKLNAHFEAKDLLQIKRTSADLTVDSSLLHCLVDDEHRRHFFNICSDITFIHTMIETSDMSEMTDRDYLTFKDEVLWSTGPERWDMDWHEINGKKMFKHRRILSEKNFLKEIEANGFEVMEYFLELNEKSSSTFIGWIKRRDI